MFSTAGVKVKKKKELRREKRKVVYSINVDPVWIFITTCVKASAEPGRV